MISFFFFVLHTHSHTHKSGSASRAWHRNQPVGNNTHPGLPSPSKNSRSLARPLPPSFFRFLRFLSLRAELSELAPFRSRPKTKILGRFFLLTQQNRLCKKESGVCVRACTPPFFLHYSMQHATASCKCSIPYSNTINSRRKGRYCGKRGNERAWAS